VSEVDTWAKVNHEGSSRTASKANDWFIQRISLEALALGSLPVVRAVATPGPS